MTWSPKFWARALGRPVGMRNSKLALVVCLMLVGCAPTPGSSPPSRGEGVAQPATTPKTLRIGTRKEPLTGIALFAGAGVGGIEPALTYHAGLTIYDDRGELHAHLAEKLPSVENGDWRVGPDGRMEVTWRLKPNVRWHDGAALAANDFTFGLQILRDEELALSRPNWLRQIDQVSAPDPATLVVTWRQPSILANASGPTDIPPVPRHLLSELYQSGD